MKTLLTFFLNLLIISSLSALEVIDSTQLDKFESQIVSYEQQDVQDFPLPQGIVFTGSSSVRMWHGLQNDLSPLPVLNRGFGGSTIPEVNYYADRIIFPYAPQIVAIYAGDNDIAKGYTPEQILENYKILVENIQRHLPDTKIYFIAIKPSVRRWDMWPQMKKANKLVMEYTKTNASLGYFDIAKPMLDSQDSIKKDIFLEDNLHMNQKGYDLWTEVIKPELQNVFPGYALWLPKIFGDHMVLQRGNKTTVWGRSNPGEAISVRIAGNVAQTTSDVQGLWQVTLPMLYAGGPHFLEIATPDQRKRFENVMIGDVWIASGQSNMEWNLSWTVDNYEEEIANANYPNLRLFKVERNISHVPEYDLKGGMWEAASPETVGDFSAVGYFFGRDVHLDQEIPVGVIHSAWGGTPAESWTSLEMLHTLPNYKSAVEKFWEHPQNFQAMLPKNERNIQIRDSLYQHAAEGLEKGVHKIKYDDSSWSNMEMPNDWSNTALAGFDGFVWFRKTIELPAEWNKKDLMLSLGKIRHNDIVYFNGQKIGENEGGMTYRNYQIPSKMVRKGKNVIAIRVLNRYGGGGLTGPADTIALYTDKKSISLTNSWKYNNQVEPEIPEVINFAGKNASLFNAMIAPMVPFGLKGFIWYQGESNASRANEYRSLFPAMIEDWRVRFRQGYLPFLFVQLANFMERKDLPSDDEWAELREAQLMTLDYPNTGMAVTIDIGNAYDIHPRNKQDVGKRLALAAKSIAYNQQLVYSGPIYESMEIEGDKILLHFKHVGSGLTTSDGGSPKSFAIAGKDQQFYWAEAEIIDKNTVSVTHPDIDQPIAVRFGWQSNPDMNLYNQEGLPASPFRTDQWQGITK